MKKFFTRMWNMVEEKFAWREPRKLLWIATMINLFLLGALFAYLGHPFVSIMTFGVVFHLFPLFGIWGDEVPFRVEHDETWLGKFLLWHPWQFRKERRFVSYYVRFILVCCSEIVDLFNLLPVLFLFTSFVLFRAWQNPVVHQFHEVVVKDGTPH